MTTCVKCKIKKVRVNLKSNSKSGRYIYVDDKGRRWNGLECPECKHLGGKPPQAKKTRICRVDRGGCGLPMGADRYFVCVDCKPVLNDDLYVGAGFEV